MMKSINVQGTLLTFDEPKIMGILNITEDSFYDGSKYNMMELALAQTEKMIEEGAHIIDIGAASSRPGAIEKSPEEELKVLEPFLSEIRKVYPDIFISIDTYHSKVAAKMINMGANMINDISAGKLDPEMEAVIIDSGVPYIIMHMLGKPRTMQNKPEYDDVVMEVLQFFTRKVFDLRAKGVKDIIVDPGFGFGKTLDHNYHLLNKLHIFKLLDCPILVGLSRKSMIYKLLGITAGESLSATSALHLQTLLNGANLLRVHDVKEAQQVITLYKKIIEHN